MSDEPKAKKKKGGGMKMILLLVVGGIFEELGAFGIEHVLAHWTLRRITQQQRPA